MKLYEKDYSLYWYIFNHLFIIISIVMISYGISNEIHVLFDYFKNDKIINSPGMIIWGSLLYLLTINNMVFFKLFKSKTLTKHDILSNLDLLIAIILLLVISPSIIFIINPLIYVFIIFIIYLGINIFNVIKVFAENNYKHIHFE